MTLSEKYRNQITSPGNPRYKTWKRYLENAADPDCPWIGIEGKKQVREITLHRNPEMLLLSNSLDPGEIRDIIDKCREVCFLPPRLLSRLSAVEQDQGIIAFFNKPEWTAGDLTDRVIILDSLQDPGNLGTILRTASAFGGFSIISSGNTVSFFNRKVVRASAGYLFLVPFIRGLKPDDLRKKGYRIWYASPGGGTPLGEADFQAPLAVAFGNEGKGLPDDGKGEAADRLTIPMESGRDSLNVAVAASLVMYEISKEI